VRPNKLKRPHHAARREQTHRSGMRTSSLKTPPAYTLSGGPWTSAVKWLRATPSAGKHEMPGGDAFANSCISRCMRVAHMCGGGRTLSCLGRRAPRRHRHERHASAGTPLWGASPVPTRRRRGILGGCNHEGIQAPAAPGGAHVLCGRHPAAATSTPEESVQGAFPTASLHVVCASNMRAKA
jgi:hypothetical protein